MPNSTLTADQLAQLVHQYRQGYTSAGGRAEDVADDAVVKAKLEEAHATSINEAQLAGQHAAEKPTTTPAPAPRPESPKPSQK